MWFTFFFPFWNWALPFSFITNALWQMTGVVANLLFPIREEWLVSSLLKDQVTKHMEGKRTDADVDSTTSLVPLETLVLNSRSVCG